MMEPEIINDFEELLLDLRRRANAGTLTRQQQVDIAVKYKDDSDAIARIAVAVFPDNVQLGECTGNSNIDIDTLY